MAMKRILKPISNLFSGKALVLEIWEPDIKFEYASVEDMKFIFDQAEKFLSHTIRVYGSTLLKTNYLLSLCTAFLSGQCVYVFNNFEDSRPFTAKMETVIVGCIYIAILSIYLTRNIMPTGVRMTGRRPELMINPAFFSEIYEKDVRQIYMYRSEIITYKISIDLNDHINKKRSKRLFVGIICLLLYPLLFVILFIFLSHLDFGFC